MSLKMSFWVDILLHFSSVSLLSVGGAITVIPEMHRYLVVQNSFITEDQFSASIAIAQSAPGPNILVVAMFGWNIGVNSFNDIYPQYFFGVLGMFIAMLGVMTPSSLLTYLTARWVSDRHDSPYVLAFKQGLSPIVIGAILATSWIISSANNEFAKDWLLWLTTGITVLLIWKTKVNILLLLAVGAALGMLGLI